MYILGKNQSSGWNQELSKTSQILLWNGTPWGYFYSVFKAYTLALEDVKCMKGIISFQTYSLLKQVRKLKIRVIALLFPVY